MCRILFFFLLLFATVCSNAQSFVLSSGEWYKISVEKTAIYKIDYQVLRKLGIKTTKINPKNIRMFAAPFTGMLPQANAEFSPTDLMEFPIQIVGEADGKFDKNDYILFFGQGTDKEEWTSDGFNYENNLYSDTAYYFINISNEDGKRITQKENLTETADLTANIFDDAVIEEQQARNLISSGRMWFGDPVFASSVKKYTKKLEGVSGSANLEIGIAAQSIEDSYMEIISNGNKVGELNVDKIPSSEKYPYEVKASYAKGNFSIRPTSNQAISLRYKATSSAARAFLDFFVIQFKKSLNFNKQTSFIQKIEAKGKTTNYTFSAQTKPVIWNVTNPFEVKNQGFNFQNNQVSFQSQSEKIERFAVFDASNVEKAQPVGKMNNQDLKSGISVDGLIVTHPLFLKEAERLAEFHRNKSNFKIKVATVNQIYNEFSAGRQDISAVRNYARFVLNNGGKLKYLLLFGDCSYDYKHRVKNKSNFVPTYQSRDSFHPVFSYCSDDYFGFLSENEGDWVENLGGDHTLDIGVGRLPVKNNDEAKKIVDKIIRYSSVAKSIEDWKNHVVYIADDEDGNLHVRDAQNLSEMLDTTFQRFQIKRLFLDNFSQNKETGGGSKSPDMTTSIQRYFKKGASLICYIGHGNEKQWTEENVFNESVINKLTNLDRLPILLTATCEFGKYDDPIFESGAEKLLLSPSGGVIALLTTTRPVYSSSNELINKAFHQEIFKQENNQFQFLGDIIKKTKNNSLAGEKNRNFTLLGDPMLRLNIPVNGIKLSSINLSDTLKSFDKVTVKGEIEEEQDGEVLVTMVGANQEKTTLGNGSTPFKYNERSVLFRGLSSVQKGKFESTFILPKGAGDVYEKGRLIFHSFDQKTKKEYTGIYTDFVIGGENNTTPKENQPPNINAYLNTSDFKNGDKVGKSSLLVIKLSDKSGIRTFSNKNEKGISLTLGEQIIDLTEYYTAAKDSYQNGTVVFSLIDLKAGKYDAKITATDVFGNRSEKIISFVVSNQPEILVFNSGIYPNPMQSKGNFFIEHDREEETLFFETFIYDYTGKILNTNKQTVYASPRIVEIPINGLLSGGAALKNGLYFCRIKISSKSDGAVKEIVKKLVINN